MPIIPRYDTISQGDIPVGKMPTPDVSMFPGYQNAQIASGVSKIGSAAEDIAGSMEIIGARVKAQTLKTEYASKADDAWEQAKAAPQEMVTTPGNDDPEGTSFPTTALVPRSQTVEANYLKRLDAIRADINAKAGSDPILQKMLQPGLDRITLQAQHVAGQQTFRYKQDEIVLSAIDSTDALVTQVRITPPPPMSQENGGAAIRLSDDRTYETMRSGIVSAFDTVKVLGGEPEKKAEAAKIAKLAKLDHGRAEQVMTSDPKGWIEASEGGRNGWSARLTPEAYDKLTTRAQAAVTRAEGSANARRLQQQRDTEDDFLLSAQPNSTTPLTRATVLQAVRDKKIDSEHAKTWLTVVDNLSNGNWESDGKTRVATLLEAQNPNVNYDTFYRKVQGLVHPGGLNTTDAATALGHARAISDKRNDRTDQLGFHTMATTHADMTTRLKTPPTLMGHAFDDTSDVIRGRASDELATVALRSGYNPEAIAKWQQDRLPFYERQITGNVKDSVKSLAATLPVAPPMVDPKTGFIERDEIDKAYKRVFKQYGVDPKQYGPLKKAGKISPEMDRAIKSLDDIESLTEYQRSTASKESNR
jgi:hypothetical protein